MKKILTWLLLLSLMLTLFVGCKDSDGAKKTEPSTPVGDYISADAAMEYLKALYKRADEATPTPRDYERYAVIRVGGEPFEVTWTVDLGEDMIKVVPGENETVKIDINEQCEQDTPYTLTASITDRGGKTVSFSWNYILPKAMDVGQVLRDAYALPEGESLPYEVTLTGKIIGIGTMYDPEYKNITVTMEVEGYPEYPIVCYRLKGDGVENLNFGNIITVTGTIKNYNGTIEFDFGCILESWEKGDAVDAPTDPLEIVKQAYALKHDQTLPYIATLTGKVTDIETPFDPEYNNITPVITIEGAEGYPITCYRLKGTGVDQIALDDVITVKGIIKNYKDKIEFDTGCMLTDRISGGRVAEKPSSDPAKIFGDIAKLGEGKHLSYFATLTGKVVDVESPYDKEYNNITVQIVVDGYKNIPVTCYRLKGNGVEKIARGDTITVKGIIENYKGKIEFGSGCTLLDRISGGGVAKPETADKKVIMKDALKLKDGEHLDYYSSLTGKVTEIDTPYDKEYQNISVIISVPGYESYPVICYRLKSGEGFDVAKIAVGDTITVRGVMENYKGKLEYGNGCTMTNRKSGGGVAKPESSNQADILKDAAKLKDGQKLSYYANLTGKVVEIDSPYDKEYGNISVYIQLSNGTKLLCYRLKSGAADVSKIAVKDTISVRGVIENYKGEIQFGSGAMLTKRVSGGGVAKPESSNQAAILKDAAKLTDGQKLSYYANLKGTVTKIDSPYDKEYGNISVYIKLSNGQQMLCYRLKSGAADVSKIAVGDTIGVRGVIENYKGELQFGSGATMTSRKSGGGVAKPESSDQVAILKDAAKLSEGQSLSYYANLKGKVTKIDSPYDKEYGNISVYIKLSNGTEMLCYRLKSGAADVSKIAVGDTIAVRGVIMKYNGAIQFGSGSTLTSRKSGGGVAKPESSNQASILKDAAALAEGESLSYYANLTGKVTRIDTPYDKEYGNISVYMELSTGTEMLCYRLKSGAFDASRIAVGDTITVRGVIMNYKGAIQFGSGCTLTKRVSGGGTAKPESSNQAKILADAAALADGEKLDYYANLTGKVVELDTPYDKEYGNISVYIELSDGTRLLCYRLKSGAADASKIAVGDTIDVRGVIENYKGELQFGNGATLMGRISGGGVAKPETSDIATIWADASALAEGEKLDYYASLTGKVTKIKDAYDASYGNMSVYIDLENGENILCYRLKSGAADVTKLRVGDTITVRGVLTNYKGAVQFDTGCTLTKLVAGYNPGDNMTPAQILEAAYALESSSDPNNKNLLEGQYTLTGVISSIDTAYASQYKNITVTMKVEGCEDKPIQAYRLTNGAADVSGLQVGDTITVTGQITKFKNKVQFDQGCVLDKVVKGESDIEIPDGSAVISFRDLANRVSYSTQQQVWKQNGITVTNDKAASTTNVYNNTSSNDMIRLYKGSNLTVEYPGMTRLVFTHTAPSSSSEYVNGLVNALSGRTDVVVTRENLTVQVDFLEPTDKLVVENLPFQIRFHEITACTGTTPPEGGGNQGGNEGGNTGSGNYGFVDAPEAGTAYKLGVKLPPMDNKNYYITGEMVNTYYFGTSTDAAAGVDVYLEAVEGGYQIYFLNAGTKTYVNIEARSDDATKGNPVYQTAAQATPSIYELNTEHKYFKTKVGSEEFYLGTYTNSSGKTFDTLSASNLSYLSDTSVIGSKQFPAWFMAEGASGSQGGNQGGTTPDQPSNPSTGNKVATVVIYNPASGKALSSNPSQSGSYYLGGVNVTVSGTAVTGYGATEQWDLIDNGDGTYSFAFGGKNLAMGTEFSSTPLGEVNDDWKVISAGDGLYYIENIGRTSNRLQWRAENYNYFSCYHSNNDGDGYKFGFHVISGTLPNFGQSSGGNQGGNEPTEGGISISFVDKANRTIFTTEQQVWEQNGITVTNDKGAGTSNIADYANPARFYKSTNLSIAYPGMTRIVFEMGTMSGKDYANDLKTALTSVSGITVTVDGVKVTVDFASASDSLVLNTLPAQIRVYNITVYTGTEGGNQGGGTETPDEPDTPDTPDTPAGGNGFVDAPVAGTAYKFGVNLPTMGNANYYVDGTNDAKYLNTTTDVAKAVDVYFEEVTGGIRLYTIQNGNKLYINMIPRDTTKVRLVYQAESEQTPSVYTVNSQYKYLTTTVSGVEYVVGTYENAGTTYTTISGSNVSFISDPSKIGVTQFPAWFMSESGNQGGGNQGGTTEPEQPETPDTPDVPTGDAVLENGAQVVIYAPAFNKALSAQKVNETSFYNKGVDVTVSGDTMTGYTDAEVWTVIVNSDGTYSFSNGGQNIGMAADYASMNLGAVNDTWELISLGNGLYNVKNVGRGNFLEWYSSKDNWSTFNASNAATDNQFQMSFYVIGKGVAGGGNQGGTTEPEQPDTPDTPVVPPVAGEGVTISFADVANRTSFSTEQQVWQQNGITVTNDKGAGTSNIADYAAPARFYKNTALTIEYPGMTKVVFNVAFADKVAGLVDSLTGRSDVNVKVEDLIVTVDLQAAADALVIESLVNQTRLNSITVYAGTTGGNQGGTTEPEQPSEPEQIEGVTLSFSDVANRTSYSAEQQIWSANGITMTNNKADSITDVFDSSAATHVRLYAGSNVIIEYSGMTRMVFDVAFAERVDPLANSLKAITGVTVTVNDLLVTADFAQCDSLTFNLAGQTRVNSITIYTGTAGGNGGTTEPEQPETPDTPDVPTGDAVLENGAQVVIYAPAFNKALSAQKVNETSFYNKGVDVTVSGDTMTGYTDAEVWTVIVNSDGTYSFSNGGQNIGMAADYASMNLGAVNDTWELISLGNGLYNVKNVGRGNFLEWYSSKDNWSTFNASNAATDNQFQMSFYVIGKGVAGGGNQGGTTEPETPDTPVVPPVAGEGATISFVDVANRVSWDANQQIWQQNGITVTNDKAGSSSNVADYSNPARFYKSTDLTIEYAGMTRIVFEMGTMSGKDYANDLKTALASVSGITVTVDGLNVIVDFASATDSLSLTTLPAQIRVYNITIYA